MGTEAMGQCMQGFVADVDAAAFHLRKYDQHGKGFKLENEVNAFAFFNQPFSLGFLRMDSWEAEPEME